MFQMRFLHPLHLLVCMAVLNSRKEDAAKMPVGGITARSCEHSRTDACSRCPPSRHVTSGGQSSSSRKLSTMNLVQDIPEWNIVVDVELDNERGELRHDHQGVHLWRPIVFTRLRASSRL